MSRGDFWSRRKAGVEAEREAERRAAEERAEALAVEKRAAALEDKSDAEICAEFGLPDPDDLKSGDVVSGFLKKEIPERLRRRALRKLWASNPVLACLDGLNDYDDDYTNNATDAPGLKTAYQVGKGLRAHVEALESQSAAEDEATTDPDKIVNAAPAEEMQKPGEAAEECISAQVDADVAPASTTMVGVEPEVYDGTQESQEEEWAPAPRRMRFRFDTETG